MKKPDMQSNQRVGILELILIDSYTGYEERVWNPWDIVHGRAHPLKRPHRKMREGASIIENLITIIPTTKQTQILLHSADARLQNAIGGENVSIIYSQLKSGDFYGK